MSDTQLYDKIHTKGKLSSQNIYNKELCKRVEGCVYSKVHKNKR